MGLLFVHYEVFGKVQKVFFRKYTAEKAQALGLRGWVMNTHQGTVAGELEGPTENVQQMKHWLQHEGSPSSHIEKTVFKNEHSVDNYSFTGFERRYPPAA